MPEERLQKILANAGIASRRKAEQLILEGRVTVNGATIVKLGAKADPSRDHIKVDGKLLRPPRAHVYLVLNKPNNCVTTAADPQGRRTVMDLVKGVKTRVYPVGRLDYHSEGLLLLTNDGEFAARIMSPATHLPKTYLVKVNGPLSAEQEGIPLRGRRTAPAGLKLIRRASNPWYEVCLVEGRQNQIRIMFKHFDRLVEKLRRIQIGFLSLGRLKLGQYRPLTPEEVARFRKLLKLPAEANTGKEFRRRT
jgi:23S rRNA pseudouridine2605 synthase